MTILDRFSLDRQVAVVTGAGKGIGRGIALALAEAGADVMLTARTQADLDMTASLIKTTGRRVDTMAMDVTQIDQLDQLAERVMDRFGKLSIWVNNAGGLPDATPRYLTRTTEEQWDAQMDLNLKAVWAGVTTAAKYMEEGGAIVNLSSRAAFGGHLRNGPYSAAKAAVNSLTETFALELAPKIRINAVAPGPIPTENLLASVRVSPEQIKELEAQFPVPLRRLGTPADIGGAVVFLASPAASWITGQCLYVTGGF